MLLQDHFEAVLEHSNPSVAEGDLEEFVDPEDESPGGLVHGSASESAQYYALLERDQVPRSCT